jgi:hypothetical protein
VVIKPGARLKSVVCATEVVVVKAPKDDLDIRCGGAPMVLVTEAAAAGGTVDAAHAAGTLTGKRYSDDAAGLELLCTKAGEGSLSLGSEPILQKDAKALPSSD